MSGGLPCPSKRWETAPLAQTLIQTERVLELARPGLSPFAAVAGLGRCRGQGAPRSRCALRRGRRRPLCEFLDMVRRGEAARVGGGSRRWPSGLAGGALPIEMLERIRSPCPEMQRPLSVETPEATTTCDDNDAQRPRRMAHDDDDSQRTTRTTTNSAGRRPTTTTIATMCDENGARRRLRR